MWKTHFHWRLLFSNTMKTMTTSYLTFLLSWQCYFNFFSFLLSNLPAFFPFSFYVILKIYRSQVFALLQKNDNLRTNLKKKQPEMFGTGKKTKIVSFSRQEQVRVTLILFTKFLTIEYRCIVDAHIFWSKASSMTRYVRPYIHP